MRGQHSETRHESDIGKRALGGTHKEVSSIALFKQ